MYRKPPTFSGRRAGGAKAAVDGLWRGCADTPVDPVHNLGTTLRITPPKIPQQAPGLRKHDPPGVWERKSTVPATSLRPEPRPHPTARGGR
ncbi:hypothetical protein GCM10022214_80980 [Actinomadura miaoliensis]|uniref:Transposase n=1 Tax=Actinomadura miaoliensis TaxID=430685 RepID=A0ABP7X4M8_9ACTN